VKTETRAPGLSRSGLSRWWGAAIVLLLVGAGFLTVGLLGHQDPLASRTTLPQASPSTSVNPAPAPATTASATASATPTRPPSTAPAKGTVKPSAVATRSTPVTLRIPAIGVSLALSTLGLNPDGTVQVPGKDQQPGWFRLGPTPGQLGSAVILGHVDDYKGPAAFYRLRALRPGDAVDVGLADGRIAHFAVRTVASYLKTQFPAQQVYAPHGYAALQLVTCGGQFDSASGHYLSNVVAYTALVSTTPAAAR
jgi:sortase (surface protein transpeptidase)